MDPSSFGILAHNYLKVHNLTLLDHPHVKTNDAPEKYGVRGFLKKKKKCL